MTFKKLIATMALGAVLFTQTSMWLTVDTAHAAGNPMIVSDEAELNAAIADNTVDLIVLDADITLTAISDINRTVAVDGAGHTIANKMLVLSADNITVNNLTVSGSDGYGIQAYRVTGIMIDTVTVMNSSKGGILANGSEITTSNVTVTNNTWGGIEVSKGSGVPEEPMLTITNSLTYAGTPDAVIWIDDQIINNGNVVNFQSAGLVEKVQTGANQVWFVNPTKYVSNEAELNAAIVNTNVDTIVFNNDITLTATGVVNRTVTIDGANFTLSNRMLVLSEDNIKVKNLTVSGSNSYGIQGYRATGIELTNITATKSAKGGILANGAEMTVTDVTLTNNAWVGIESSKGQGVTENPTVTLSGSLDYAWASKIVIWIDNSVVNNNNVVNFANVGLIEVVYTAGNKVLFVYPTMYVSNEAELIDAIATPWVNTIIFSGDITLSSKLIVNRMVDINGSGYALSGFELVLDADSTTVRNLTVSNAVGYGIHAYTASGVVLENITINNATKGGILVNGSEVTVNGITLNNNTWGGIEVSTGVGVLTAPKLTINGAISYSGTLENVLWIDKKNTNDGWIVGYTAAGLMEKTATGSNSQPQLWFVKIPAPTPPAWGGGWFGWGGGGSSFNPNNTTSTWTTTNTGTEEVVLPGEVDETFGNEDICSVSGSVHSKEENDAYRFACGNRITTMPTVQEARMSDKITRAEIAKMISQYAINVMGATPNTSKDCSAFANSIKNYDAEMKGFMTMSCQLGLMGIYSNHTAMTDFMPNQYVTRGEFGTVISRLLWGAKYESQDKANWSTLHLNALKDAEIITNTNPNIMELRSWVMIILQRVSNM